MGRFLKSKPALKVLVVGHTDNQGALDANLELSRRRAQAVVAARVSQQGIAAARLTKQGVGMAAPVASNASEAGEEPASGTGVAVTDREERFTTRGHPTLRAGQAGHEGLHGQRQSLCVFPRARSCALVVQCCSLVPE